MTNLKAIFTLPKWAKVFLGVLSAVAGLLIVATLWLNQSAKGEIYSANLVLKSKKSLESSNQIAYNLWIDFPKFKPLLRSKSISRVDITQFLWDKGVDKNAIESLRAGGRNVWLESTQDLGMLGVESLGKVEYKVDFSPLLKNITKYFGILLCGFLAIIMLNCYSRRVLRFDCVILGQIRDFICTPQFKKIFIFGFLLYSIALFALFRGNIYYIDDWGRSIYGSDWNNFSRFIATCLAKILGFGSILDISPIYQFCGIGLMVLASMMILYAFNAYATNKNFTYWGMLALLPLGLSPYFLENLSYKFDTLNMSFAVFCACLPFIFKKYGFIFCIVSCVSLLLMFCSYQSANSVYILLALFLTFNSVILRQMSIKEGIKFFGLSGVNLIISSLIYKLFVVKEVDTYVSSSMLPLNELFVGIVKNLIHYLQILHTDFVQGGVSVFFIFVCVVCMIFIIAVLINRKNFIYFFVALLFLVICVSLSYGLYLVLVKPLFVPRAFNGIGAFVALLFLSTLTLLPKVSLLNNICKICVALFGYICIAFANSYGNAITKQQEYIVFRANLVLSDLLRLGVDSHNVGVTIKGNIGYEPATKRLVLEHKVASRIIPILMSEGWGWNASAFWHLKSPYTMYYDPKECESLKNKSSKYKKRFNKSKILLDNEYHTISQFDSCVILTLKTRDS